MAACLADEFGLGSPIGLIAMVALRTGTRRVPRVPRQDGAPGPFRLVRQEGVELPERPSREPMARVAAPSREPPADALEVFRRDPATGAFGVLDDRLADPVVLVAA